MVFCGGVDYPFSEQFPQLIAMWGADYMWKMLVDSGDMSAWEFRFWSGHRGLV